MKIDDPVAIISFGLRIGTLDKIEEARGAQSRSSFLRDIVETYFEVIEEEEEEEL